MAETKTNRIARMFLARTLPEPEWTHHAHFRVGLWHLLRYDAAETMDRLRRGIRAYNEAVGTINSDASGYHETFTRFYVTMIAAFVSSRDRSQPLDEMAADLLVEVGDKDLPFRYYSRERILSVIARREWVEPDLAPLPDSESGPWPEDPSGSDRAGCRAVTSKS